MAVKAKKPRFKAKRHAEDAPRVDVALLLDRTGSMASNWKETIVAVNAYVQKVINDTSLKARVQLTVFDKMGAEPEIIRVRKWSSDDCWPCDDTDKWLQYNDNEHPPRGNTPLLDAIGQELSALRNENKRKKRDKRIQFVVMTDGQENASSKWNIDAVRVLIKECQDLPGWSVIFLGADIDAVSDGMAMGLGYGSTMTYSGVNAGDTIATALASNTARFAATGQAQAWTVEERVRAVKKTRLVK